MQKKLKKENIVQEYNDTVNSIKELVNISLIAFSEFDNQKKVFIPKAVSSISSPVIQSVLKVVRKMMPGFAIEKIIFHPKVNSFIGKTVEDKKISITEKLPELTKNIVPDAPMKFVQNTRGIKMIGLFPVISEQEVVGLITVLSKRKIINKEIKIIKICASQIVKIIEANRLIQELKRKISEIERLNKLMVDREVKMVELKRRIKKLENRSAQNKD